MEDGIGGRHRGLIEGLTALYQLLVSMNYISADDVCYPPNFHLLQVMPCLRPAITWGWQQSATQIAPQSMALTYIGLEHGGDYRPIMAVRLTRDCFDGTTDPVLPPWVLLLSDGGSFGPHLLYNTKDASITQPCWINGGPEWNKHPNRPADVALSEMIAKLRRLEWVQHHDPRDRSRPDPGKDRREIVGNPLEVENMRYFSPTGKQLPVDDIPTALEAYRQEFPHDNGRLLRQRINYWRALQKLYRYAGWGVEGFRVEEFEEKKVRLLTTGDSLQHDMQNKQLAGPSHNSLAAMFTENLDMEEQVYEDHHGSMEFLQTEGQRLEEEAATKKW